MRGLDRARRCRRCGRGSSRCPSPPTTTIESPMRAPRLLERRRSSRRRRVEEVHDLVAQVGDVARRRRRAVRRAIGARPPRGRAVDLAARAAAGRRPRGGAASSSSMKPAPPASTTPASRSTGSSSGVRAERVGVRRPRPPRARRRATRPRSAAALGGLGRLAHDGEDRALDRPHHRLVGGVGGARAAPRRRRRRSTSRRGAERVGEPAQDLRQDHAGVAAGPISEPWLIALHIASRSAPATRASRRRPTRG